MNSFDQCQQENKKAKNKVSNKVKNQEEHRWLERSNTALVTMKIVGAGQKKRRPTDIEFFESRDQVYTPWYAKHLTQLLARDK